MPRAPYVPVLPAGRAYGPSGHPWSGVQPRHRSRWRGSSGAPLGALLFALFWLEGCTAAHVMEVHLKMRKGA